MTMTPTSDDRTEDDPAQNWLAIKDVARLTGVNPVTLRAWERRYGLIVPRRTPKGHRLYSNSHVQRIKAIVNWLNRGVAVSQVKPLLETPQPVIVDEHSQWHGLQQEMLVAVSRLAERHLDDSFNRATALYPPRILYEHLLVPLLKSLEQRWHKRFGSALERSLFQSWLRTKLGNRLYHSNRQHNGAPLLLVNLCDQHFEPDLWFCAWLASSVGCPVEVLEWTVPSAELPLVLEPLAPRGLLLYASQSLNGGYLRRQLPRLIATAGVPVLLAGPAVLIHQTELREFPDLILANDPLAVLEALQTNPLFAAGQENSR